MSADETLLTATMRVTRVEALARLEVTAFDTPQRCYVGPERARVKLETDDGSDVTIEDWTLGPFPTVGDRFVVQVKTLPEVQGV